MDAVMVAHISYLGNILPGHSLLRIGKLQLSMGFQIFSYILVGRF
jgi:hypothetical protein